MEVMSPGRTRLARGTQARKVMQYDLAKEVLLWSTQYDFINHWRVELSKRIIERYMRKSGQPGRAGRVWRVLPTTG